VVQCRYNILQYGAICGLCLNYLTKNISQTWWSSVGNILQYGTSCDLCLNYLTKNISQTWWSSVGNILQYGTSCGLCLNYLTKKISQTWWSSVGNILQYGAICRVYFNVQFYTKCAVLNPFVQFLKLKCADSAVTKLTKIALIKTVFSFTRYPCGCSRKFQNCCH
jgi:hypothetical protein